MAIDGATEHKDGMSVAMPELPDRRAPSDGTHPTAVRACALITRVSTFGQAQNPEGSLTNQLQRLRARLEFENRAGDERWIEKEIVELKGVSGSKSVNSVEFADLLRAVRAGSVNTVVFTSIDRVGRSVMDVLSFFDTLTKLDVRIVCLKQNVDTTSPFGKAMTTIFAALAQMEREMTCERNREATLARAERGLWNGGQILGYDLVPGKKGGLEPNPREVVIGEEAMRTYLRTGSILKTAAWLNDQGYRTKEYTSTRGKFHPGKKFTWSSTRWLLTNYAYIGKKEVNKKKQWADQKALPERERYRIVDGAWPAVVDEETFNAVQKLMAKNDRSNRNQAAKVRHTYVFNGGLLFCGKCGTQMEGRSGTSHQGTRYYYYGCRNKACGFKVSAVEIERVVLDRLRVLSMRDDILKPLVERTNLALQKELPQLTEQRSFLQKDLTDVRNFAGSVMKEWQTMASADGSIFLKEKLEDLAQRRKDIEQGIAEIEKMIMEIRQEAVSQELIKMALGQITEVFGALPPHQQKELIRLILQRAEVSETGLRLALHGRPPEEGVLQEAWTAGEEGSSPRSGALAWLRG